MSKADKPQKKETYQLAGDAAGDKSSERDAPNPPKPRVSAMDSSSLEHSFGMYGIPAGTSHYYGDIVPGDKDNDPVHLDLYNSNILPYQHWILSRGHRTVTSSSTREALCRASQLFKKVAFDRVRKLVERGWYYTKHGSEETEDEIYPEYTEIPNGIWSNTLKEEFIWAVGMALGIGSSFLTRMDKVDTYRTFFPRHLYGRHYYGNDYEEITEVYFKRKRIRNFLHENGKSYPRRIIGFLTQYAEETERPSRISRTHFGINNSRQGEGETEKIYKDCVHICPHKSVDHPLGRSHFLIELNTALQKIWLKSAAFAHLHSGGSKPFIAFPDNADESTEKEFAKEMKRGIFGMGFLMNTQGGNISDLIEVTEFPFKDPKFENLNDLISEDASVTQQKVKGKAESGALGGSAPDINRIEDVESDDEILHVAEKVIKDINETFFGYEQYTEEKEINGIRVKEPKYDVVFIMPDLGDELEDKNVESEGSGDQQDKNSNSNSNNENQDQKEFPNSFSYKGLAVENSVHDDFRVFEGNLFEAGLYPYPERKDMKELIITGKDIKRMTERNVRTGYLGLDHSQEDSDIDLMEGWGYFKILNYNEIQQKDETLFYIKEKEIPLLKQKGWIREKMVDGKKKLIFDVSPKFDRGMDQKGNVELSIRNAIIVPPGEVPRAHLGGMETSATEVN